MNREFCRRTVCLIVLFFIILTIVRKRMQTQDSVIYDTVLSTPSSIIHFIESTNETSIFLNDSIMEDVYIKPIVNSENQCEVQSWNNITTNVLPQSEEYKEWMRKCSGCHRVTMNDGEMRLISAFVYSDYIAVVTSLLGTKNNGRKVYCHYYDCNRRSLELPFVSNLFPLATVRCARRIGAEFISLSFNGTYIPTDPIPISLRLKKPEHEIGVCAGQIYGKGSKSNILIEFIEHHRLIGASMFYLLIFNTDEPTTRVIHDYQRLGLLDPTWVNLEFQEITWQFHLIQMPDCFHRSRMHSKWTINIDINERFMMRNPKSFSTFLRSLPSDIAGLSFPISRVHITNQIDTGNLFENYKKTSRPLWSNLKSIYQHEYSHIMFYHWSSKIDKGYKVLSINNTVGYFRHYRVSDDEFLSEKWSKRFAPYNNNILNQKFEVTLKSRIFSRFNYLFNRRHISCDAIHPDFIGMFRQPTVRCARRAGAEFISLSFHETDNPLNAIPLIPRIDKPKHDIGVCAGQIYGKGTKWTTLVEFIEHHRLIGVSMFYLLIFNTDEPTTRVIHDYQRLGLLDPTWVNLEFQEITWQFHMIQMPDCFHRSRMHSKWTINIDIDERFMMRNPKSLSTFLRSLPSDVAGLSFPISLIKGVTSPVDDMQTTLFETYKKMSRPKYTNFKSIYQHEHSHLLFYHWASAVDEGYKVMILNNTVGYFRHYRVYGDKFLPANWMDVYAPYLDNKLNDDFAKILKSRFVSRIRYLFDRKHITCDEVDPLFFKMFEKRNKCIFRNGTKINFE